jgi:hypothetical protein
MMNPPDRGFDYGRIDSSVGLNVAGWYNGDFNYDGKINVDDYGIIDSNVTVVGPPLGSAAGPAGASVAAVPEPAGGIVLAAAGLTMARRRRRVRRIKCS